MSLGAGSSAYTDDVLGAIASGLATDTRETGKRALEVVRTRAPELVSLSEQTGEDVVGTSAGFIEILLASLRTDVDLPWSEYEQRSRDFGRLRSAQGVPLESLIDVLAVYRRATIELVSLPLLGSPRHDELYGLAQRRLEDVTERLTTSIARGYLQHIAEEHLARESEMYGLAAVVTAMARSLDVHETAEVALVESLAALRLSTAALWLRERSTYKLMHTVGLDEDQVEEFGRQVGPHAPASASAMGRSESEVDRISSAEWNALRVQLKVRGRVVGTIERRDNCGPRVQRGRPPVRGGRGRPGCHRARPRAPVRERGTDGPPHRARQPSRVRKGDGA